MIERKEGLGSSKVRLVGVLIHPMFVVDDGDVLTELPVDPIKVTSSDWPNVVGLLDDARSKLEDQVNGI